MIPMKGVVKDVSQLIAIGDFRIHEYQNNPESCSFALMKEVLWHQAFLNEDLAQLQKYLKQALSVMKYVEDRREEKWHMNGNRDSLRSALLCAKKTKPADERRPH